jgi:hypothetical protein
VLICLLVPIYDVRDMSGFEFLPEQLSDVNNLPQWVPDFSSETDLDADQYVVTVGYTENTFLAGGREPGQPKTPAVLLNVMFVIVLGNVA